MIDKNHDHTFNKLLEKVVIKVRTKAVQKKHLRVGVKDVTPCPLFCPETSEVVEVQGLDIEEEKKDW